MRDMIREKLRHSLATIDADFDLSAHDLFPAIESFRPAAVLVPIINHPDELTVLLTRRPDHMNKHAGQVAFPGGRIDPTDPSALAAALREAEEEVGIPAHHVEIVGRLDNYRTGTGFQILPVVGIVTPGFEIKANAGEVAEVFEVPLSFLMDPGNHQRKSTEYNGVTRHYFAMPYKEYYIWGATAGMLVNLFNRLYG